VNAWIHVPYVWHATLLEALWPLSGIVSTVLTVMNLVDSWKDKALLEAIRDDKSVHALHYGMIKLAAEGRISSQFTRLRISLLIVIVGAYGVWEPNPLAGKTTWTGLLLTGCLVAIAIETAGRSFRDLTQRNLLYEMATRRSAVLAAKLKADNLEQ
jgi:hypothetical protein